MVVESTLNWYWLVDGLEEAGFEVKLAHTLGLFMITGAKVKTDRRDAFTLARLLNPDLDWEPLYPTIICELIRPGRQLRNYWCLRSPS